MTSGRRRADVGWGLQKLYLVGFTRDLRGLILSRQKGVKSGGFIVDLDEQFLRTLDEVYRLHEADGPGVDAPLDGNVEAVEVPAPTPVAHPHPAPKPQPDPAAEQPAVAAERRKPANRGILSPKDIQAELRAGKTVQEVARMAGTDASWIERFLSPILAERKGIVDAVMGGMISRPRRGRSVITVGQAIVVNLKERKVPISPEDLEDAWQVARRNGQWQVTLHYTVRGQAKQAQFSYDPDTGVEALDADASVIGWWAPSAARRAAGSDADGEPAEPTEEAAAPAREALAAGKSKPAAKPVAPAKAKAKPKARPVTRQEVEAASAALWGATKVTPPTAPARRSSFIGVGKADAPAGSRRQSGVSKTAGAGRPQPPPPVKRLPGAADDRPVFARNSSAPRQKRLMTTDDAEWRSAVARTRAARKGGAPLPEPPPQRERPVRPKRLPDDWLLGE